MKTHKENIFIICFFRVFIIVYALLEMCYFLIFGHIYIYIYIYIYIIIIFVGFFFPGCRVGTTAL